MLLNQMSDYEKGKQYIDTDTIYEQIPKAEVERANTLMLVISKVLEKIYYKNVKYYDKNQFNNYLVYYIFETYPKATITYNDERMQIEKIENQEISVKDGFERPIKNVLETLCRNNIMGKNMRGNVHEYSWTGNEIKDFENITNLLEHEKEYLDNYHKLVSIVNNIDDISAKRKMKEYNEIYSDNQATDIIGFATAAYSTNNIGMVKALERSIPAYFSIDIIKKMSSELIGVLNKIDINTTDIIANLLKRRIGDNVVSISNIQSQRSTSLLSTVEQLKSELLSIYPIIKVLHRNELSKQIVLTKNLEIEKISSEALRILKQQEKTIYIINILSENKPRDRWDFIYKNGEKSKEHKESIKENMLEISYDPLYQNFDQILGKVKEWIE